MLTLRTLLALSGQPSSKLHNGTYRLGCNNVHGEVPSPGVVLLAERVNSVAACRLACATYLSAGKTCHTFTWHHGDFAKPQYAGHCYGHTDVAWAPVAQAKIDSGCVDPRINCTPCSDKPSPPSPPRCNENFDCSGSNGKCTSGVCQCYPGWTGEVCGIVDFKPRSGRKAYESPLWTWGGSVIRDDNERYHMYSSVISENCGILHYCSNSFVAHLTASSPEGPFVLSYGNSTNDGAALAPRPGEWDNGAIHGVSVYRLPNRSYALFYMGSEQKKPYVHPNCTAGSGDAAANHTIGSHAGRRIGVAISESLDGPWRRLSTPIFGPDPNAWDNSDVSNPAPIIHPNGSVILLYKGNGHGQHMGLAYAPSIDGPYVRYKGGSVKPDLPGEDPCVCCVLNCARDPCS